MRSRISHLFFNLFILLVAQTTFAAFDDIQRIYHQQPNLNQLEICQGGGCAKLSLIILNNADWYPVELLFNQPAQTAEQEREKIAAAIGLIEVIVGNKAGTSEDKAGTFNNTAYSGQQDCNDEAINSTTYMRLLKQAGYMVFHEIEDMRTRNFFFTGWPHTTAVIHEIETGERFAVDSWFYDNGHPATIVPFHVWKTNYQPVDSPIGKPRAD
jgi:hypothetical protein